MGRNRIYIPPGTLANDEMEHVAGKLFKCGYTLKKGKVDKGDLKGSRYIEFWIDKTEVKDGRTENN